MCGITGIIALKKTALPFLEKINAAIETQTKRGPDSKGIYQHQNVALAQTRLSIIDTTEASNQPFIDSTGRYTMIFNGEIYNFKSIRQRLMQKGYSFHTQGDTEVLLYAYIEWGAEALPLLNGFFTIAIHDKKEDTLFIARDRMGIKPLLVYQDEEKLIFGSEMKALLAFELPKKLDMNSLAAYLQLNYIPSPYSIFQNIKKLEKGHYLFIKPKKNRGANGIQYEIKKEKYYEIPSFTATKTKLSYPDAQKKLVELLSEAVQKRLIADVPLGTFLSGGIDSSVITALAAQHTKHLNTFSIGYKDEPMFDETHYANLVAKKYQTNHTVFSLTNDDLFAHLHKTLDYIDEPFADPSALAVNILSYYTRQKVTVALSGDGADELFAGYNKHRAAYLSRNDNWAATLVKMAAPIWSRLPQSRHTKMGNLFRQLDRFASAARLPHSERYWQWASISPTTEVAALLLQNFDNEVFTERKNSILQPISNNGNLNDELYVDMNLVLVGDMLHKVDSMSMCNSLEVRTPFLDHEVVNFAFSLPVAYKIDKHLKKKIVQDAFRSYLPLELYNRPKHGFEVPLLKWFKTELKDMITKDLLAEDWLREQGIFKPTIVNNLLNRLFSNNPQDAAKKTWALIVFQHWYKKWNIAVSD